MLSSAPVGWVGSGDVLLTPTRDSWVWDMELWKNIRANAESFFEQVAYVVGVGHCIRFQYDHWSGHTSSSKGSI